MLDLAITQKESTTSLLNMGARYRVSPLHDTSGLIISHRYFDFRPAYLIPGVRDVVSSGDNT